jgi:hypothetical protein
MRLKSLLLYSLIFSSSSLFAGYSEFIAIKAWANDNTHCETIKSSYAGSYCKYITGGGSWAAVVDTTCSDITYLRGVDMDAYSSDNASTGYCRYKPGCTLPQIFDVESELCQSPIPECKPEDNQVLNVSTNTCDCVDGFVMHNGVCSPDTDGDGIPDVTDDDIDGDGIPNDLDPDIDGDGIPNDLDENPTSPDENSPDTFCKGMDLTTRVYFGTKFNISDYHSKGYKYPDTCGLYLSQSEYDSAFEYSDLNPKCSERKYCYVHYADENDKTKCSYSASDRKPSGYVYISNLNEDECTEKDDGTTYIHHIYDVPHSIACPGVAYCFLKPKVDSPDDSNTEDEDDSMDDNLDLNSTTQDNKALLQASNTTNKHLSDIKDKTDLTNKSLEKINETNTNLLASSKDINKNLTNTNDTLSNSLTQQKLMNETLSNINKSISNTNSNTKSLNSILLSSDKKLHNIDSNTKAINDNIQAGLFSDTDPFADVDLTDDGSSKFGEFETTLSDNLNLTYETNLFGLSSLSGGGVSPVTFVMFGTTFTPLSMETINLIPIHIVKAVLMFMAAIGGFITVFRTV